MFACENPSSQVCAFGPSPRTGSEEADQHAHQDVYGHHEPVLPVGSSELPGWRDVERIERETAGDCKRNRVQRPEPAGDRENDVDVDPAEQQDEDEMTTDRDRRG